MIEKKEYFDYNDVNLIPNLGIVGSRSECDTSIVIGKHKFKLPIVPANMESVISEYLAYKLANKGYFYILHRFMDNHDQVRFVEYMKEQKLITSISIGVNEESYELLKTLKNKNLIPDYITIDIAHGHSSKMELMLNHIKNDNFFSDTFVIAGNVSTANGAYYLYEWGADAIKVGISNGYACTTYMSTNFGSRGIQPAIIRDISEYFDSWERRPMIIADGAVSEFGHIAVALTMGADMVMAGSLFSGYDGVPSELIEGENGELYKKYYGSASADNGKENRIEGTTKLVPFKDKDILTGYREIEEALQSAISYAGGVNLDAFNTVKYIIKK